MKHPNENRIFIWLLAGLALVLALVAPVWADPEVTASDVNFGMVGENEFAAGYVVIPRIPIYWQSGEPWRLTVNSMDSDMGPSNDGSYVKPAEDVYWRVSETEEWLPISISGEEIDWSDETGSGVVYIDLAIQLDWMTDAPGEYRIDLEFTIDPM